MVFGTYNIVLENTPSPGQSLLYNTLSRSSYVLTTQMCAELISGHTPSGLSEDDVSQLRSRLILVDDRDVEKAMLRYRINEQRYAGGTVNLTIYTTYRCNFRCTYCYEKESNVLESAEMSMSTVDSLFRWLESYVEGRSIGHLYLELYGGEPLCNMPIVKYIVQHVSEFVSSKNITVETYIVSNGSLLTPDVVALLRRINLVQAQVTLDGYGEHHNRRRPLKNGSPTYDTITSNLRNLAGVCTLVLRVNVDESVLPEPEPVYRLVDDLASMGVPQSIETVIHISQVFGLSWDCGCFTYTMDYRQLRDLRLKVYPYAMSKGFGIIHPLRNAPCFAISAGCFTVDPLGDIYSCSFLAGKTDYRIGQVTTDEFTPTYFRMQTAESFDDECLDCCYLPACLGGCRAHALLERRGFNSKLCAKEFFENAIVPFLGLYYTGARRC